MLEVDLALGRVHSHDVGAEAVVPPCPAPALEAEGVVDG